MKRSAIGPGKRCPSCKDGSCGSCTRGFIIKRPKKAARLPAKAPKRASLDKDYTRQRQAFLLRFPRCLTLGPHGPCQQPATDVHHRKGRGRYHLDESTWWACCSACHHLKIHAQPAWSRRMCYLLNRANDSIEEPSATFLPYSL